MQKLCSSGVRRLAKCGDTATTTRATTAAAALPSLLSSTRCLTTAASSSLSRGAAAQRALRNTAAGRQEKARRGSRGVSSQQHPRGKRGDLPLRADASPATAAFHAFLRQQNSPYVSTAAAASGNNDAQTTGQVPQQALVDAERLSVASDGIADLLSDAGAMDNTVLREWRVGPPTPPPPPSSSAASPQAGKKPSSGQQNPRASSPHNEELRRYNAIEQARRHTTRQLSERHRYIYERDVLHAYQLLKNVEGVMFHWSRQRRRRGQSEEAAGGAAGDVDVVEGRCFEYAGQIQRTLHQLTPAHFDGMRDYRLRRSTRDGTAPRGSSSSSSTSSSSPPLPLLHLRLLWRLLHVTELFYAIGRQASLPRSVVQSYVRSANCAYGIREVLRVLGDGVVTAASGLSTTNTFTAAPTTLSRDELFQMFYAVLCIPAEEAPGVPIYDPALLVQEYGAAAPQLRFQIDCVATGATAARMPLDEWCVRWWCHCYEEHHSANAADRSSSSSSGASSEMSAVLSMGQAMDVIRAALYATRSANAAVPTASSSMSASSQSFSVVVSPFSYFETPPRGVEKTALRRGSSTRPGDSSGDEHSPHAAPQSEQQQQQQRQQRRSRPHLVGALGGDRTALRIPYHLGQRFVTAFLRHLLASATTRGEGSEEAGDAAVVEAAMLKLLRRPDRDAVRDVALLCTAILYFEVFSAQTATFMARAAPLCREQVELLSGHEISCVLLAYATLQRWEGSVEGGSAAVHKGGAGRGERRGPAATPVRVRSASTVAAAATAAASDRSRDGAGESAKANANPASATAGVKQEEQQNNIGEERVHHDASQHTGRPSSGGKTSQTQQDGAATATADSPTSPWHLFYVTLGSRAGQLSDSLGEEDVTRVLRAMEIVGMEHEDLRRALESSLRMRNLGRRLLYET